MTLLTDRCPACQAEHDESDDGTFWCPVCEICWFHWGPAEESARLADHPARPSVAGLLNKQRGSHV